MIWVHNKFFSNFPRVLLKDLLLAINQSWSHASILSQHKLSTLLLIAKFEKDPTSVESYRPISLLSCFSKLIENLVKIGCTHMLKIRIIFPLIQLDNCERYTIFSVILQTFL